MTLQACYEAMGADYNDVIGRLRSERLVQKFVLKFLDDGSYDLLLTSMHTIEGMCQNLSFSTLAASSSELTEALRGGATEVDDLLIKVKEDYQRTADAINAFKAENGL